MYANWYFDVFAQGERVLCFLIHFMQSCWGCMQTGIVMSLRKVEECCLCQTVFFRYDHQNAMFLYIMHDRGSGSSDFQGEGY